MFLLDTNVVSELRKAQTGHADENVVAWQVRTIPDACYLSAITLLELEIGVLRIERRDPVQGTSLQRWLHGKVLREFEGRILPVDGVVALRCASLHVPDQRSERDAMIAATALVHGLTVITRNVADFVSTGVATINPWQKHEPE